MYNLFLYVITIVLLRYSVLKFTIFSKDFSSLLTYVAYLHIKYVIIFLLRYCVIKF